MRRNGVTMMLKMLNGFFNGSRHSGKEADLNNLTRLVRRYSVEQQQVPKDLAELVALNYIETIPAPPLGQKFVIDRKGVKSGSNRLVALKTLVDRIGHAVRFPFIDGPPAPS